MCIHGCYHVVENTALGIQPSPRPENVRILPPDSFGSSNTMETLTDFGATGDEVAVNVVSLRGHCLETESSYGCPEAKSLADNGLQVRESLCFGPADWLANGT